MYVLNFYTQGITITVENTVQDSASLCQLCSVRWVIELYEILEENLKACAALREMGYSGSERAGWREQGGKEEEGCHHCALMLCMLMLGSASKVEVLAACLKVGRETCVCVHVLAMLWSVRRHCRVSSVVTFGL